LRLNVAVISNEDSRGLTPEILHDRHRFTSPCYGLVAVAAAGVTRAARADETIDARHAMEEAAITVDRVREEMKSGSALDDQLKRAKGVLIIPSYYKASFIIGGSYGDGVLMARLPEGGFSDPAFYRMTAGSLGLQIGGQSAAVIFVILTEKV